MSNNAAKSRKYRNRRRRRSRLRLILTQSETAELDRAVADSGAIFRSLIIAEAIHAGLSRLGEFTVTPERRCRRVDIWMPRGTEDQIKRAAQAYRTTQQKLLRHYLFEYIANAPWKTIEAENGRTEEVVVS
jgi:isocitrate dehydrogenase kinase/phosphatase